MKKLIFIYGLVIPFAFLFSCHSNRSNMVDTKGNSDSTAVSKSYKDVDTNHHEILAMPIVIPEQDFINYALPKNINEIVYLKVALIKGDAAIKSIAKIMLKEHAKFNEQIKAWMSKHSSFATPANDTLRETNSQNKIGTEFNIAWIEKSINDQKELLSNFKNAQIVVKDSALNKIISNSISMVESHLAKLKIMQLAQTK